MVEDADLQFLHEATGKRRQQPVQQDRGRDQPNDQ